MNRSLRPHWNDGMGVWWKIALVWVLGVAWFTTLWFLVKWCGFSQPPRVRAHHLVDLPLSQLQGRFYSQPGVIRSVPPPCSARRAIRGVSWGPKTIPGISWKRPTSVSTTRPLAFIDFIYIYRKAWRIITKHGGTSLFNKMLGGMALWPSKKWGNNMILDHWRAIPHFQGDPRLHLAWIQWTYPATPVQLDLVIFLIFVFPNFFCTNPVKHTILLKSVGYICTSHSYDNMIAAFIHTPMPIDWLIFPGISPIEVLRNPKAYYTSPYIHTVTLSGLSGSSEYSFRPEGSSRQGWGSETVGGTAPQCTVM